MGVTLDHHDYPAIYPTQQSYASELFILMHYRRQWWVFMYIFRTFPHLAQNPIVYIKISEKSTKFYWFYHCTTFQPSAILTLFVSLLCGRWQCPALLLFQKLQLNCNPTYRSLENSSNNHLNHFELTSSNLQKLQLITFFPWRKL